VIELVLYKQDDGRCPFNEWFDGLRDKKAQSRISSRLFNVQAGNLGDCASVGEGVIELRVHIGAGYRVYCGRSGTSLVILLSGGDKSSQSKDILRAKSFWADWKRGEDGAI
jgi:putative addiction module killer protein